jgi:hypothetical protein
MQQSTETGDRGMPGWQPNWVDVRFAHARAEAAAAACDAAAATADAACDAAAATADAVTGALPPVAARASADWQGNLVAIFEEQHRARGQGLDTTAADLRRLAADLRRASAEARAEQSRRESERARWREEKAAADLRRAEQAAALRDLRMPR